MALHPNTLQVTLYHHQDISKLVHTPVFLPKLLRIPIIRAFLRLYYFLGDTETNPYQPLHMNFLYSAKAGYNVS